MGGETHPGLDTSAPPSGEKPQPKLDFFLVRRDGTHVPMIALDEIDPRFEVAGLPKTLTAYDVEKWNMGRVGDIIPGPRMTYEVLYVGNDETRMPDTQDSSPVDGTPSMTSSAGEDYEGLSAQIPTAEDGPSAPSPVESSPVKEVNTDPGLAHSNGSENHFDQAGRQHNAAIRNHPSKTKDAMTPGVYGKKKYCTFWIRTGNCDYVQEGCKYLHIIPDEETRHSIGIRDMPRWAKEDLPAPSQSQRSKMDHPELKKDWRRGRAAADTAAAANSAPQSSKTFTPSIPSFLNKSNGRTAPKEASKEAPRNGKTLNPTAQSFEAFSRRASAGNGNINGNVNGHVNDNLSGNLHGNGNVSSNGNSNNIASKSHQFNQQSFTNGIPPSRIPPAVPVSQESPLNGNSNKVSSDNTSHSIPRIPSSNGNISKPRFFAPDRMPTPTQAPTSTPSTPSKFFASVTYPTATTPTIQPPQSPWPSQQSPWNSTATTTTPTARRQFWPSSSSTSQTQSKPFTRVSGFRTPAEYLSSFSLGGGSSNNDGLSAYPSASTNGFDSSSNGGGHYRSDSTNGRATPSVIGSGKAKNGGTSTTKPESMASAFSGGVAHPRLFARAGEPKFAVVER